MTDPQCPHIKSSPPVPDILFSVRRIDRFSVVIGPTGIMSIVAISSPIRGSLGDIHSSKTRADQPDCSKCLIFASGDMGSETGQRRKMPTYKGREQGARTLKERGPWS